MGEAEISSQFEYSASFLRIMIPGLIVTTLVSFLLSFSYSQCLSLLNSTIDNSVWALIPLGVSFVFISIFIGLMLYIFIIPLTQLLEGYYFKRYRENYFIGVITDMLERKQWKKFARHEEAYDSGALGSVKRGFAYNRLYEYFSDCLYSISNNPQIEDEELKKCILPTKLGNAFNSLEIYPKWKYGMNGIFFWRRIELLLTPENKKTLDNMRAFVDMFILLTGIFFFAAIGYCLVLAYNKQFIFSVVSVVLFIIFSLVSYYMAVLSTVNYGYYVRSIFDLYRNDLWVKIKEKQFVLLDKLSEEKRWGKIYRYLRFHK
jgi:hypothetical protein